MPVICSGRQRRPRKPRISGNDELAKIEGILFIYKNNIMEAEHDDDYVAADFNANISEKMIHLEEIAYIVYNLNNVDFSLVLSEYIQTQKMPIIDRNTSDEIKNKRITN